MFAVAIFVELFCRQDSFNQNLSVILVCFLLYESFDTHTLFFMVFKCFVFSYGKNGMKLWEHHIHWKKEKVDVLIFTPLMVRLRFFFCFRLLIFWGNFVECMILFLARVILGCGGWLGWIGRVEKCFLDIILVSYGNNVKEILNYWNDMVSLKNP